MTQHEPDQKEEDSRKTGAREDAATGRDNAPAGHPRRKGNEITGTREPQPPSGLRPDLEDAEEGGRGGDGGGVDKSM